MTTKRPAFAIDRTSSVGVKSVGRLLIGHSVSYSPRSSPDSGLSLPIPITLSFFLHLFPFTLLPPPSSLLPLPLSLSLSFSPYPLPLRFPASIEKFVTNLRSYSRAMSQVTLRQLLCCWNCCSGIVGYYQIKVMSTKNKPNPDFSLQFIRVLNEYIVKSINRHT